MDRDSKGGSENSPVDCFPAVGESPGFQTHPARDVDGNRNGFPGCPIGESPASRTRSVRTVGGKPKFVAEDFRGCFFLYGTERDSKGGSENSPVDCFPAVGESPGFLSAVRKDRGQEGDVRRRRSG